MHKPQIDVSVKAVNMQGPRIQANINQVSFSCLLDSGSTFSIMPYHLFKQLNISEFQLNCKTKYNINSASHRNEDAVLGTYIFNLNIEKANKSVLICPQLFLILRKTYSLEHKLLGEDFLVKYDCHIKYDGKKQNVIITTYNNLL